MLLAIHSQCFPSRSTPWASSCQGERSRLGCWWSPVSSQWPDLGYSTTPLPCNVHIVERPVFFRYYLCSGHTLVVSAVMLALSGLTLSPSHQALCDVVLQGPDWAPFSWVAPPALLSCLVQSFSLKHSDFQIPPSDLCPSLKAGTHKHCFIFPRELLISFQNKNGNNIFIFLLNGFLSPSHLHLPNCT